MFMRICVYICMVAVFIWWTPLAVVHVQRVTSVALQVLLVHLVHVRLDSTVQGETQQAQVFLIQLIQFHVSTAIINQCMLIHALHELKLM